jgi:hypothetical protein
MASSASSDHDSVSVVSQADRSARTDRFDRPIHRAVLHEMQDESLGVFRRLEQATEMANRLSIETVRTRVAAVLPTLERRVQRRHDMVQVTEHTQVRSALDGVGRRADG